MRTSAFLIVLIFHACPVQSQSPYNFASDWEFHLSTYTPAGATAPAGVSRITFTEKTNKKIHTYFKVYNPAGEFTDLYHITKKGLQVLRAHAEYDNNGYRCKEQRYKKGKLRSTSEYKRTSDGRPLLQQRTNRKNKIISKFEWRYSSDSCISELLFYKRNGNIVKKKWVYEYYDNCKLLRALLYNRKGKLKQEWSYGCNAEGEKLEKKKNTTQVCQWSKSSDSTITKVYQQFDEKGRTVKQVYIFTLKDTLPLEQHLYDHFQRLVYKRFYKLSYDKVLGSISYTKKGKIRFESKYEYADTLLLSTTWKTKGKITSRTLYTYNSDQLVVEIKNYGKKGYLNRVTALAYEKKE
ncbi:MAG: hypothetical protein ACHQF2_04940 [Flavobacteriales bacterium]